MKPQCLPITPEIFAQVCDRIAAGATLAQVCRDMQLERFRVWNYRQANPEAQSDYARARESQAEVWEDELLKISDETDRDTIERENGGPIPDAEWIARSRLRVDTRKWIMARSHPKGYGERMTVDGKQEHTHEAGKSLLGVLRGHQDAIAERAGPKS